MLNPHFLLPSRNISVRLALYLFVMNIVMLLVSSIVGYQFTVKLISKNTAYYAESYIRSMTNELDFYNRDIEFMTLSLFFDQGLFADLNNDISKFETRGYFDTLLISHDYINDIFIINNEGKAGGTSSVSDQMIAKSAIYKRILESDGELVASPVGYPDFVLNTDRSKQKVLFLGRKIKSPDTNETKGIVIVTLLADRLFQITDKPDKKYDEQIVIIDKEAKIIYNPNPNSDSDYIDRFKAFSNEKVQSFSENGDMYIMGGNKSDKIMTAVGIIPKQTMLKDAAAIRNMLALINLMLLAVVVFISLYLSYNFLKPILRLAKFMSRVSQQDLVPYKSKEWKDEVGFLIMSFNKMIYRLQESFQRVEHERDKQKKAEMRALQAQINPHFVFNTLNNVRWLAKMGKNEEVFEMITAMNGILVGAFQLDKPVITIDEELNYLREYVNIQQMIHKDRFDLKYAIDEAILSYCIPKMSLQPLVENAIFHGILPKRELGFIQIKGFSAGDRIYIQIEDNGVGFAPDSTDSSRRERVGMDNVSKRLQLYFGEAYGVVRSRSQGKGTLVTIVLPKQGMEVLT